MDEVMLFPDKTLSQFMALILLIGLGIILIVVFYGDCVLKDISFVPEGSFIVKSGRVMEAVNIILDKNEVAPYTNKHEVVRILREAVQNGEKREIQTQHIENIKNMLGRHRVFD
jgi:hypothetical protein